MDFLPMSHRMWDFENITLMEVSSEIPKLILNKSVIECDTSMECYVQFCGNSRSPEALLCSCLHKYSFIPKPICQSSR